MRHLKTTALVAALAAAAGPALAGGFAPVIVDTPPLVVVEPEAPRSSFGVLLPLALLGGLVALAVAAEDNEEETDTTN